MTAQLQGIITLLIEPPGNLIYYMVLTFSIAGALPAAFSLWGLNNYSHGKRMVAGLCLLLLTRLFLFIISGVGWQGLFPAHLLLPPVDRVVDLVSLILIAWLWAFPEKSHPGDAAALLLSLFTLTLSVLGAVWWYTHGEGISYNGSLLDRVGEIWALLVILIGGLVILIRKPAGWGFGFFCLVILFIGHFVHLLLPLPEVDYPAAVRLAQMLAYPILLVLPQHLPLPTLLSTVSPEDQFDVSTLAIRRPTSDPKLVQALLSIGAKVETAVLSDAITSAIARAMNADVCLFISPPDKDGQMIIHCYYDLIREENSPGAVLQSRQAPVIASALRHARALRLLASETSQDLINLAHVLNLKRAGNLLAAPIPKANGKTLFGLILLTPFTSRQWTGEDQNNLAQYAKSLAHLLQQTQMLVDLRNELAQTKDSLQSAHADVKQYRQEKDSLAVQLQALQKPGRRVGQAPDLQTRVSTNEEAQRTIVHLQSEIERLQHASHRLATMVQGTFTVEKTGDVEPDQLKGELRLALEEIARLRTVFLETDQSISSGAPAETAMLASSEQIDAFASIVKELRQPVSTITGYTDFLLGETVGILGNLQRKFLKRIKQSTERMNHLIEELVQASSLETAISQLNFQPVNLNDILGKSIIQAQDQLKQKNVSVQFETPAKLPNLATDREALQQVVTSLLENAGCVTPEGGRVAMRAEVKREGEEQVFILLQIADQGGGILYQDMPRIFSPINRVPIKGVEDNFTGLSIVKTLVESLKGRIWVDSETGVGTTFSVLLPVFEPAPPSDNAGDVQP